MTAHRTPHTISRRNALTGLGAGSIGLAVAARSQTVLAQEAGAIALHPIVGSWNVVTPGGPAPGIFFADGTVLVVVQATQVGPWGVTFVSAQPGTWEPVSERGIHFTGVQLHSDARGAFVGSVTIDGYPVVSEDGLTIFDDQSQGTITIRDAAGVILQEVATAGAPPVTGVRMGVGAPGFPDTDATPDASPESR